ncbi:MAG: hypothetical protein ABI369_09040 [Acetobacteraceae bacterium]
MSNALSSRGVQGSPRTVLDGMRQSIAVWGPLALLTLAAVYACAGLVLLHGAPASSATVASPSRFVAAALISTTPMILALAVSSRPEAGRTKARRLVILTIGLVVSLPLAALATVWSLG